MRVAILGGGAVGLALAASLASNKGNRVCLLLRGTGARVVRTDGVRVDKPDGNCSRIPPEALDVVNMETTDPGVIDCDILFVATKAYQVAEALLLLFPSDGDRSRAGAVVLLQNGWGSADEARSVLPPEVPVYSGVVLAGLSRLDANHARINGVSAPLAIGSLFGEARDLLDPLVTASANSLLPLAHATDIRSNMLHKLLLNTTLNATCTLTGLTYGELLTLDVVRPLALSVAREALDVLDKALDFRAFDSAVAFIDDYLRPLIIPRTAPHRPSMAQDVEFGRRTEIDYINGAIVRLAKENAMTAPVNESLAAMIKARTQREKPALPSAAS